MKCGPSPLPDVWGVYLTLSSLQEERSVWIIACCQQPRPHTALRVSEQHPAQPWGPPQVPQPARPWALWTPILPCPPPAPRVVPVCTPALGSPAAPLCQDLTIRASVSPSVQWDSYNHSLWRRGWGTDSALWGYVCQTSSESTVGVGGLGVPLEASTTAPPSAPGFSPSPSNHGMRWGL